MANEGYHEPTTSITSASMPAKTDAAGTIRVMTHALFSVAEARDPS